MVFLHTLFTRPKNKKLKLYNGARLFYLIIYDAPELIEVMIIGYRFRSVGSSFSITGINSGSQGRFESPDWGLGIADFGLKGFQKHQIYCPMVHGIEKRIEMCMVIKRQIRISKSKIRNHNYLSSARTAGHR